MVLERARQASREVSLEDADDGAVITATSHSESDECVKSSQSPISSELSMSDEALPPLQTTKVKKSKI